MFGIIAARRFDFEEINLLEDETETEIETETETKTEKKEELKDVKGTLLTGYHRQQSTFLYVQGSTVFSLLDLNHNYKKFVWCV